MYVVRCIADALSSVIFYGPPGSGKTTLASVVARHCSAAFYTLNAASASVKITARERDLKGDVVKLWQPVVMDKELEDCKRWEQEAGGAGSL